MKKVAFCCPADARSFASEFAVITRSLRFPKVIEGTKEVLIGLLSPRMGAKDLLETVQKFQWHGGFCWEDYQPIEVTLEDGVGDVRNR